MPGGFDLSAPVRLLKTGEWLPEAIVEQVMRTLRMLFDENVLAFFELVESTRNPGPRVPPALRAQLIELELADPGPDNSLVVRNKVAAVVQAAVVGHLAAMELGSPYPETS